MGKTRFLAALAAYCKEIGEPLDSLDEKANWEAYQLNPKHFNYLRRYVNPAYCRDCRVNHP